jgi:Domain of unknown function (DUF4376)
MINKPIFSLLDPEDNVVVEKMEMSPNRPELEDGWRYVPWQEPLDVKKLNLIKQVKDIRDRKMVQGGYKVSDKWFHSDTYSRSQQLGLVLLGATLPGNIDWKTMDGSKIRLTVPLVQQIFSSALTQDSSLFAYAEYLVTLIEGASDVSSIDVNAGWPETYKGI